MRSLVFFVLFALVASSSVSAAELKVLQEEKLSYQEVEAGGCTLSLEGVIEKGDAARLIKILETRWDASSIGESVDALCLNSPGGSLDEAITIAHGLYQRSFATVVPPNHECLSACAVVFMGGTLRVEDFLNKGAWKNARYMFASSRVGFHAPMLEVSKGSYSETTVEKAFVVAMTALGRLAEKLSSPSYGENVAIFPYSLLAEMLKHHGQDFMYIQFVEQAGAWDINVIGLKDAEHSYRNLRLLCESAGRWFWDKPGLDWEQDPNLAKRLVDPFQGRITQTAAQAWRVQRLIPQNSYCNIRRQADGKFIVGFETGGAQIGEAVFAGWAAFPGNTKLTAIAE